MLFRSNPSRGEGKSGTIGQPIVATRVRLVDKEDPSRDAPPGEPGEIVLAGPQIMAGYWDRPETDDTTFCHDANGTRWLRTGDVGQIDEDGFIRIVDRLKDMISVGGFKVFPKHVEDVLYRHPAIKEVLVVGMPDPRMGEVPRAYVALNEDAEPVTGEELRTWLNPQVGKHERVDAVMVREKLPKTMIGKLSRKDLLLEIAAEAAATPPAS